MIANKALNIVLEKSSGNGARSVWFWFKKGRFCMRVGSWPNLSTISIFDELPHVIINQYNMFPRNDLPSEIVICKSIRDLLHGKNKHIVESYSTFKDRQEVEPARRLLRLIHNRADARQTMAKRLVCQQNCLLFGELMEWLTTVSQYLHKDWHQYPQESLRRADRVIDTAKAVFLIVPTALDILRAALQDHGYTFSGIPPNPKLKKALQRTKSERSPDVYEELSNSVNQFIELREHAETLEKATHRTRLRIADRLVARWIGEADQLTARVESFVSKVK